MYWLTFIISSVFIVIGGTQLTINADGISDRLHLGKVWVGVLLLGFVTSLPEAISSLTAVISLNAGDLAVGNMLGSDCINPMLIVIMDMIYRKGSVTSAIQSRKSQVISAHLAIILTLLVVLEIQFDTALNVTVYKHLTLGNIMVMLVYFFGMKILADLSPAEVELVPASARPDREQSLRVIFAKFILSTCIVVIAAVYLAKSADVIARKTGLGQTFVGTLFLASVTSLPELVVTLSALKIGAFDLALGNIFGSNMTNIFIIFLSAAFFPSAPLLSIVSKTHMLTGVLGIFLVSTIILGIKIKKKPVILGLGMDSLVMTAFFVYVMTLVYKLR